MLLKTGKSLLELRSNDLFDVAYRLCIDRSLFDEEQDKVITAVNNRFSDLEYEEMTNAPAITKWLPPADEMYGEP